METFAAKLIAFTAAHPGAAFTGPLEFMNTWSYELGRARWRGRSPPRGPSPSSRPASSSGIIDGCLLYNATAGQPRYNASLASWGTQAGAEDDEPDEELAVGAVLGDGGFFGV